MHTLKNSYWVIKINAMCCDKRIMNTITEKHNMTHLEKIWNNSHVSPFNNKHYRSNNAYRNIKQSLLRFSDNGGMRTWQCTCSNWLNKKHNTIFTQTRSSRNQNNARNPQHWTRPPPTPPPLPNRWTERLWCKHQLMFIPKRVRSKVLSLTCRIYNIRFFFLPLNFTL